MFKNIDNITMRFITREDKPTIYKAIDENRDFLGVYVDFIKDITEKDFDSLMKNWEAIQILGRGFQVGLFEDDKYIGQCNVSIDTYDNRGEIGYWLIESATGKGVMTRAVDQLTSFTFRFHDLNKITIKCVDTNEKSLAIPKRLGFIYEGTLREHQKLNGIYRDLQVFSKLRREWEIN